MSEKLNTVFEKLGEFLKYNDCTRLCVPVGLTISSSGDHYYVRYSMSSPTGHKKLDTAIEEIEDFLKEHNCETQVQQQHRLRS